MIKKECVNQINMFLNVAIENNTPVCIHTKSDNIKMHITCDACNISIGSENILEINQDRSDISFDIGLFDTVSMDEDGYDTNFVLSNENLELYIDFVCLTK